MLKQITHIAGQSRYKIVCRRNLLLLVIEALLGVFDPDPLLGPLELDTEAADRDGLQISVPQLEKYNSMT